MVLGYRAQAAVGYLAIYGLIKHSISKGELKMRVILASLVLFLEGCAVNPVPDGYTGPLSSIKDSVVVYSSSKADFFEVSKVNGDNIKSSREATIKSNQGRGNNMTPVVLQRQIPSRPTVFTITGRTHHAMPIVALASTEYEVSGDVKFSPIPTHVYVVKGQLGETYSAVWIEDAMTSAIVEPKIEVHGSAALNMFLK